MGREGGREREEEGEREGEGGGEHVRGVETVVSKFTLHHCMSYCMSGFFLIGEGGREGEGGEEYSVSLPQ